MLARAFAAGVPARWVTGDSVYGADRRLRMWLETQPQAYVLAVSGQAYVWADGQQRPVKSLLATLPEEGWTRRSAGGGAKAHAGMTAASSPWRRRWSLAGVAGCWCGAASARPRS
jgi:SRSO17 transposase